MYIKIMIQKPILQITLSGKVTDNFENEMCFFSNST